MRKILLSIILIFFSFNFVFANKILSTEVINNKEIKITSDKKLNFEKNEKLKSDLDLYLTLEIKEKTKINDKTYEIKFKNNLTQNLDYTFLSLSQDVFSGDFIIKNKKIILNKSKGIEKILLAGDNCIKIIFKNSLKTNINIILWQKIDILNIEKGYNKGEIFILVKNNLLEYRDYILTGTKIKGNNGEISLKNFVEEINTYELKKYIENDLDGHAYYDYNKDYLYIYDKYLDDFLEKSKENLLYFYKKKGKKIIIKIDNLVEKIEKRNNLESIYKIYNKILTVKNKYKLKNLTDIKNHKILSGLDYINIKLVIAIKNIQKNKELEEQRKIEEEKRIIEKKVKEKFINSLNERDKIFINSELNKLQKSFLNQLEKLQKNLNFHVNGKANFYIFYNDDYYGKINSNIEIEKYLLKFNGEKKANFELNSKFNSKLETSNTKNIFNLAGDLKYIFTKRDGYLFSNNIKENYKKNIEKGDKINFPNYRILTKIGDIILANGTNKYLWDNGEYGNYIDNLIGSIFYSTKGLKENINKKGLQFYKKEGNKYYFTQSRESYRTEKSYKQALKDEIKNNVNSYLEIGKKENKIIFSFEKKGLYNKDEIIKNIYNTILSKKYEIQSFRYKLFSNVIIGVKNNGEDIYSNKLKKKTDIFIDFSNKKANGIFYINKYYNKKYSENYKIIFNLDFDRKIKFLIKTEKEGNNKIKKEWKVEGNIQTNIEIKEKVKIKKPNQEDLFKGSNSVYKKL